MRSLSISLLVTALSGLCLLPRATAQEDDRLTVALELDAITNALSRTPEGRMFIFFPRNDGTTGPSVTEILPNKTTVAYPDVFWNSWNASSPDAESLSTRQFVHPSTQRVGPDGNLWVVDRGTPPTFQSSPKLVSFNLTTNTVSRSYPLGNFTGTTSGLDDVRFNGRRAYLSDTQVPSLVVLDLDTGYARRVLVDDRSTTAVFPKSAEGTLLRAVNGSFSYSNADQIEVSPDGEYLYFQPCNGDMSRVATRYLDAALYDDDAAAALSGYVEPFSLTPATGGTAIDADGNIYVGDTDRQSVWRVYPNGSSSLLVHDPRLLWVDAMWVDSNNTLWMPAAQLNRAELFLQPGNVSNTLSWPMQVFTMDIDTGPSAIDHA